MGKNKLKKFADMETYDCVFQYPFSRLRMWTGASEAVASGMTNVAFLRTSIELIDAFFAPGEVSEIWITFPDPQMKKATKRLTSDRFLGIYARILRDGGIINLKTDSPFRRPLCHGRQ